MNLVPLLILPVIGGYIFSRAYLPSYYASARESHHRLYFRCVQYGLYLSIISIVLHIMLYQFDPYQTLVTATDGIFKTKQSASGIWSNGGVALILLLTFLLPHSIRIFGYILKIEAAELVNRKKTQYHEKAIRSDELMQLLTYSLKIETPIMFSFDNGKVYVGWPITEPDPALELKFIRIMPYLSGYRDKDTHKEVFTTDYIVILDLIENTNDDALSHLSSNDFEILIPIDKITSAHLFDTAAYIEFKKQENNNAEDETSTDPG